MTRETCAQCGETVPVGVIQWGGATPYCPECFGTETGPVCGDCSLDMGDCFDAWPDAVQDGLDTVPCAVCGQTANAGV